VDSFIVLEWIAELNCAFFLHAHGLMDDKERALKEV
jgi:hypothetical protein